MAQTCTKCSRANPADAVYCYYDGMVLNGHGRAGGPVAVGSQAFASPFVFPSGKACRNFNELALACQGDWDAARELLQQGFLGNFLGGLGRIDLAMAAKQAATFPDHDRGLDELLGKLPADVLQPPKLALETQEINLGHTPFGTLRKLELKMENQGGRLLYGTVTCPDGWLSFGDQPGVSSKTFQFTHDMTIPVKVVGDRLRAGNKPLETSIVIDSSGGTKSITVRADVPVKPFPGSLFAGAKSPRQVAEKAKANAKTNGAECAAIFERGEVRNWYKDNGWTYPVQGRDASGLGAVQQFFEALGLTPAPKVSVNQKSINLTGNPGQRLTASVEVKTEEKKPVHADGSCDETWVEVPRAKLKGNTATVTFTVTVPNTPGQTATAKLTVLSNGNQKFVIPVNVQVTGTYIPGAPIPVQAVPAHAVAAVPVAAVPVAAVPVRAVAAAPVVAAVVAAPVVAASVAASPFQNEADDFGAMTAPSTGSRGGGSRRGGRSSAPPSNPLVHLIPAGLLLIAVLAVVVVDLIRTPASAEVARNNQNETDIKPDDGSSTEIKKPKDKPKGPDKDNTDPNRWKFNIKDPAPKLGLQFAENRRFGLVMIGVPDPRPEYKDKFKKLTYWEDGQSNNTIIKIGNNEYFFGRKSLQNKWSGPKGLNMDLKLPRGRYGETSEMDFTMEKIMVKQDVEIVPSPQGYLDTCLIWYTITNYGNTPQKVGIRVMMDTYIGANDGVPFLIPGRRGFLTTMEEFPQKSIPDYIEAVENPDDPDNLGTIVKMQLKGIKLPGVPEIEDIESMRICRWPENKDVKWKWEMEPMNKIPENKDSCVALYWKDDMMNPLEVRHVAFTYGLSKIEISGSDPTPEAPPMKNETAMAMSVPSPVLMNTDFYATAYLWRTQLGQKVRLKFLDEGLSLAPGESEEKTVTEVGNRVKVEWKVRAGKPGTYKIQATSEKSKTKPREVQVRDAKTSIFG
jgi:hypothetical protein